MEPGFDRRLSSWLAELASTHEDEVDCDALIQVLETIVVAAERGEQLQAVLPEIAIHLEHCPECRECYDTLVALASEPE